jgi:hypothetical protein
MRRGDGHPPRRFARPGGNVRRKNRLSSLVFSDTEWTYVKTAAAAAGTRVATFIREATLRASHFPPELRDQRKQESPS